MVKHRAQDLLLLSVRRCVFLIEFLLVCPTSCGYASLGGRVAPGAASGSGVVQPLHPAMLLDSLFTPAEKPISVVSMFAGCGGLDLGFLGGFVFQGIRCQRLPFEIIAAYDHDDRCVKTYNQNLGARFHDGEAIAKKMDLAKAEVSAMPKADVLIGGFPCQEFAQCGPRGGLDTERGKLFRVMVNYLVEHKPLVFVAENVLGLQTMDGGQVLAVIKSAFENAGYRVITHTLYAPEYGVPQTRTRIFLVGVRKEIAKDPRAPKRTHIGTTPTISWAIDDLKTITDESVSNQSQYFRANRAKKGHGQGDEVSQPNLPAYTVRANSKSRIQFHHELPRRLTVRECARIQTFPDWFEFPFAATRNMYQIGNAVPPLLGYRIAVTVAGLIRRLQKAVPPKRSSITTANERAR